MSADPGGYYGGPAAPAQPQDWAISALPSPRVADQPPPRAQVPVGPRKRTSYERTRMIVGTVLLAFVAAIVGVSLVITNEGTSSAGKTATDSIKSAGKAVLKSDLSNVATAEESALSSTGTYALTLGQLMTAGFVPSSTTTVRVIVGTQTRYCVAATSTLGGTMYLDSARGTPSGTPCH
ncbi:MAG TPA: hypothetical protein VHE83_00025 [Mycobacteriales bacterium]|nr:hypothetical protein [Mycobacteriales bacterium]